MARDLTNTRQNKRLEQLAKEREEADDAAFLVVLSTEDGRRTVCRLARDLGWMGETWDASSARQTDYNAGRQSGAQHLMTWAERVGPHEFLAAIGEATKRDHEMAELSKAATIEKQEEDDDNG